MILWFIVGFIVWALCILFMLAICHGGHRIRGHEYEPKPYFRYMENTRKVRNPIRGVTKGTALLLHN